jgi:undecaprenyl phosphate-alpha-L-ara4N flippase subunit ArnE
MHTSWAQNRIGILLMILSSGFVCVGQMFWKLSATGNFLHLFLGLALYGFGAIVMLIAYRYGDLSVMQPVLSLNYVFAIIIAQLVLGETITAPRYVGIAVIVAGVVLIGGEKH